MRARSVLVVTALILLAGCSSSGSDGTAAKPPRSTTTSTAATSTTSSSSSSTTEPTVPFDGGTAKVVTAGTTDRTALLTDVRVHHEGGLDRIELQFRGTEVPEATVEYVDEPRADGSGNRVEVEGGAYLTVRLTPAASVDLTGEEPVRSYTGPDRVRGTTSAVTEVVHTGDFEGVLTWVAGVRAEVPFRIVLPPSTGTIVIELQPQASTSGA